jgi:hypothetical protein
MRAEEYRRYAKECMAHAAFQTQPDARIHLIEMAGAWTRLAEKAEKNGKIDAEPKT